MQISNGNSSNTQPLDLARPGQGARADQVEDAAGMSTDARLKKACREFEGQFFDLMLQEMRKTIPKDQLLGDDAHTQEIFTGMMDDQIAQDMAKHGGANDLADQLYRQLTNANAPSAAPTAAQASAAAEATSPAPVFGRGNRGARAPFTPEENQTNR